MKLHEAYPNDLRIVFKQLPLSMHPWAQLAAETAMSAGAQGKFVQFDEFLFSHQADVSKRLGEKAKAMGKGPGEERAEDVQREVFVDLGTEFGLDAAKLRSDLEGRVHQARVQKEAQEAAKLGVNGTPGSFVNGRYFVGAQPFESFKAEIEKELAWKRDGNRPNLPKGTNVAQLQPQGAQAPAGPDPAKVYDLKPGDSPSAGPGGAKVTILHYLDYQ
jgi:hypothetical protein